ncbi:lactonase family protein [Trinickia sp. EG282A]|uniref:lactonase family protein n=1 Tax=Trinickia sp. EG282A TaxID=3237013 RepID=UPI0034D24045
MLVTYAYVGCRTTRARNARGKGISVYRIDSTTGRWEPIEVCPAMDNPSFLALNAQQDRLYAVHGDGSDVSSYCIDHATGRLEMLNTQSCAGMNPVHLALSRDRASLVVSNYATGAVARMPLGADGELLPVASMVNLSGLPGPHRTEQSSSHPHQISRYATVRYNSNWHIVPDKGLDTVFAVQWKENGEPMLMAHRCREGSGPRHAAFHPMSPIVYVANELDSTVTTWRFDVFTGELEPLDTVSTIPRSMHGPTSAAGIAIDPTGRHLYVSNRGHDSVVTFTLDGASGFPKEPRWTDTQGEFPRFICLSPCGDHLYAANERSDTIVQFLRDKVAGNLTPTGRTIHTGSPVCIVFKNN